MAENALAVKIPNRVKAVATIRRGEWVPLHARPRKLRIPGGKVALVQKDGHVSLVGRAERLEGPMKVKLVTGQTKDSGYGRLRLSSVKRPAKPRSVAIRWRVIGQFRYFDPKTWTARIVGPPVDRPQGRYLDESVASGLAT
jgi:hypothetical protein